MTKLALVPLICVMAAACAPVATVKYDRNIRTLKFQKPGRKISIGLVYFSDSRSAAEKLGVDMIPEKRSLRMLLTKQAEEMLLRNGNFASVTILTDLDMPQFTDDKELERFRRSFEADYLFGGEILDAKIIKKNREMSIGYKIGTFFSSGIVPEHYDYVGQVALRGKLISLAEGKVLWEGEGKSNFLPRGGLVKRENILTAALHNALGSMLSEMSEVFALKVQEIQ